MSSWRDYRLWAVIAAVLFALATAAFATAAVINTSKLASNADKLRANSDKLAVTSEILQAQHRVEDQCLAYISDLVRAGDTAIMHPSDAAAVAAFMTISANPPPNCVGA